MRRGHHLHAFQHLDPALRLPCLGCLGLEAFDKARQVGNLPLLRDKGGLLYRQARGLGFFVIGITAAGQAQALLVDGNDVPDHGVEKITIVRNQQQGRRRSFQPALQPQHRVEIEVIGRLVKQQQIGTAGQGAGEIQPNPPATGKVRHRPREVGIAESQPVQHLGGARLGGVTIDIGIAGVQTANGFTVAARFRSAQFAFDTPQLAIAIQHEFQRGCRQRRRFLGDAGNLPAGGQFQIARFSMQLPRHQGKQAGFSTAVGPHHTHLPAGVKLQGSIDDQWPSGAGKSKLA